MNLDKDFEDTLVLNEAARLRDKSDSHVSKMFNKSEATRARLALALEFLNTVVKMESESFYTTNNSKDHQETYPTELVSSAQQAATILKKYLK